MSLGTTLPSQADRFAIQERGEEEVARESHDREGSTHRLRGE